MEDTSAITKISLPDAMPPFTTVQSVSSTEALVGRNRAHYHPDTIEICCVVRGQLDWFANEETFAVRPGETLIIPAGTVHGAVDSNLQPCEIFAVHLAPEQLPPSLAEAASDFTTRRIRHADISLLLRRIFEEHKLKSQFLPEIVAALGSLLVATIAQAEDEREEGAHSRIIRLAQRAIMGKNGVRPTVDEVADRLGVSSVWLNKLFVRETGASPGDWARAQRLANSKRLLEEGKLSTIAIAMHIGYATGQSFATAFRKEFGMNPSEYRALHATPEATQSRTVYCVNMRETWIGGVRLYPPE